MELAYKFRIYPNKKQEQQIRKTFGCTRFIYNFFLVQRRDAWNNERRSITRFKQDKQLPELKKQYPWLAEADSTALQSAVKDLDTAYQNFFKKRSNYPCFKKKKSSHQSYTARMVTNNISVSEKSVKLPKLGDMKCRVSRKIEGRILSATVSADPDGTFNVLEGNGYGASRCLLMAIENPENVSHRPPLTEPELAICKAVGAKWISMDTGSKQLKTTAIDLWSAEPDEDEGYYTPNKPNDFLAYINANLFPSMKPGDCFMIK